MQKPSPDRAWYLIYSKPKQERQAREQLTRQGYETFLPLMRCKKRRQNRRIEVIEPLFPRYLFIHLSTTHDNWSPIRSTVGVSDMVRFGGEPARVPEPLIAFLHEQMDENGVRDMRPAPPAVGERVRIDSGTFAGFEGILTARTGRDRVILLLEIAGGGARVELDADSLEPQDQPFT